MIHRNWAAGGTVFITAILMGGIAPASAESALRCELLNDGVEYRAFLPDQKRYVYIAVKTLYGYYPSVFVLVDKNYIDSHSKPVASNPLTQWWLDRSRPMTFSSDKVKVRWADRSGFKAITTWFSDPDLGEVSGTVRGLEPAGKEFSGTGSSDTNTFTFQSRIELTGFSGDEFDVLLPSVSYDGVTVTPPVVHFVREDHAIKTQC